MNVRISSAKRSGSQPPIDGLGAASFFPSSLPKSPRPFFCSMSAAVDGELRNGVRLDVMRAGERAEVGDQFLLVARRQQRREEDDVGNPGRQRGDGRVARVDQDEVRADQFPNDALEDGGLAVVRLDREHERQGLGPYHEQKEHGADGREDHDRPVLEL